MDRGLQLIKHRIRIPSLVALLLSLLMVSTGQAANTEGVEPDKLIMQLFKEMNSRLQANKELIAADRKQLVSIGEKVLGPYVSFEKMSMKILGKHWRKMTPDQKARYSKALRTKIAYDMASRYDPEKSYKLEVGGVKYNKRKTRVRVNSNVIKESGEKVAVDYQLAFDKKKNVWQVYEVFGEGISVLNGYKAAAKEQIKREGVEFVIADLEAQGAKDKAVVETQSSDEPPAAPQTLQVEVSSGEAMAAQ